MKPLKGLVCAGIAIAGIGLTGCGKHMGANNDEYRWHPGKDNDERMSQRSQDWNNGQIDNGPLANKKHQDRDVQYGRYDSRGTYRTGTMDSDSQINSGADKSSSSDSPDFRSGMQLKHGEWNKPGFQSSGGTFQGGSDSTEGAYQQ